jgi:hypothetical protein
MTFLVGVSGQSVRSIAKKERYNFYPTNQFKILFHIHFLLFHLIFLHDHSYYMLIHRHECVLALPFLKTACFLVISLMFTEIGKEHI